MNRLIEVESQELANRLLNMRASLDEIKTTQLISNDSGLKHYQVPESGEWQSVEVVRGNNPATNMVDIPITWGGWNASLNIDCEFEPKNQSFPVVYPFLEVEMNGVVWKIVFMPSLNLEYRATASEYVISTAGGLLVDKTDYSADKLLFKYNISAEILKFIGGNQVQGGSVMVRMRFRVRSSDTGIIRIKARVRG